MRARWTYVSTGTLVAIALGAPFVLPRALDSHGSAAFALQALAPPQAENAVVHMDALPQPKRAPRVQHVASRTVAPRVVSHASLASVRPQATPTAAHKTAPHHPLAHVNHWYPKHRPAPVDTARAPAPPPPSPPTPVVAAQPQPVNLNATTDEPAAPAPAPAQPVAVVASVPENDQGSSGGADEHANGNGNGHDKEHGNGNGHGHDRGN
jgi:hypothetical protein